MRVRLSIIQDCGSYYIKQWMGDYNSIEEARERLLKNYYLKPISVNDMHYFTILPYIIMKSKFGSMFMAEIKYE